MSIPKNPRLVSVALAAALAVCGCRQEPANESREYPDKATTANGGLVGPVKDDTSAEIVSWVDGQPVADWAGSAEELRFHTAHPGAVPYR